MKVNLKASCPCARFPVDGGHYVRWRIVPDSPEGKVILIENPPCNRLTAELPDGSLVTVYYQRAEGDGFTSLLWTKWKFSDRKP